MIRKSTLLLVMLAIACAGGIILTVGELNVSMPNVSAITTGNSIGVYWNRAATNSCRTINWGEINRGSSEKLTVYVKNEGNESLYYLLTTGQWYPSNAQQYLSLGWNYSGTRASPGSVVQVTLTLRVSYQIQDVTDFSFDIVLLGNSRIWGDINNDGRVDVRDLIVLALSYGSFSGSPNWNPAADINQDGKVDVKDLWIAAQNYGKS